MHLICLNLLDTFLYLAHDEFKTTYRRYFRRDGYEIRQGSFDNKALSIINVCSKYISSKVETLRAA